MTLTLRRIHSAAYGVFGVLIDPDRGPFAVTLEYSDDAAGFGTVIPPGAYTCKRTTYFKGGYETYEIIGVDGHTRLLFHKGNYEKDTRGCILVGKSFEGNWISGSARAFEEFEDRIGGAAQFELRVEGEKS